MIVQIIIGIFAASFLEWMVHKHILHELGKKKVSIFLLKTNGRIEEKLKISPTYISTHLTREANWSMEAQKAFVSSLKTNELMY